MKSHRIIAAAATLALAATPVALAKKDGESHGKGKEKSALKGQNGKGKGKAKPRTVVVKGTVVSSDAAAKTVVVNVTKGNRRGRDYLGMITFTLADAKLSVGDSNLDGVIDAADLLADDKVVVKAKLPARAESDVSYPARQVVDQTHPAEPEDEDEDEDAEETETTPVVEPTV